VILKGWCSVSRLSGVFWMLFAVFFMAGCASTASKNPVDPLEGFNRGVFAANEKMDAYALKPAAQAYQASVPLPARTNVSNFFGNLEDVWTGVNNLLQGKPKDGLNDFGRFAVNSTLGILGFFDVASEIGLDKNDEDFGQTLGVWGVGTGPFVMLPLFGPSTLRDTGGFVIDRLAFNPNSMIASIPQRNATSGLKVINTRAQFLGAGNALDEAALDKYNYLRDFYLKRRLNQVFDGNPPREDDFYR